METKTYITEFEDNMAWGKAPFYKNLAKGETMMMKNII